MLPPGRRRSMRLLPVLLTFLLYFVPFTSAASAVLGIDLGTEYIKAALVKPGMPFEIVLSKDSKRKEASAVAFKPQKGVIPEGTFPERSYGSDALNLAARFPGEVFPNLKHLVGVSATGKAAKDYGIRYPALGLTKAVSGDGAAFKSSAFHKDEPPFAVEELLAMELMNVRENAQALAGKAHRVSSVVFTIPAFYTAEERKAVEVAAELAGLNVLGMVSDGMAVGLHYATSRTFPSVSEGAKPEYHLVFDMGAGSTVATVLRMQGRTIKEGRFNKPVQEVTVLGSGWDKTLGGDALNMIIVEDMVSKFVETTAFKALSKTADDVRTHGRAMARMFKDAEKARQVLSANKQTSASFEALFEDVDFRYKLTRDDFEKSTSEFSERLDAPINAALKTANLTFADLTSVILHGGATRSPFVMSKLESLVGDSAKLRTNVNADEAAVMGAAFKAAQISPSFRVKDIVAGDAAGYATFLQYTLDGKGKTQKLFTPTSSIGVSKQVTFKDLEDFTFKMYQARGASDESASAPATHNFETKNVASAVKQLVDKGCGKENITNTWSIRLNSVNALPEVVKASLSCVVEVPEKKSMVDGVKGMFGFGKNKDQEPLKEDTDASSSASESSSSSSSTASSDGSKSTASAKDGKAKKDDKPTPPKTKTETIKIEFTTSCDGCKELPAAEISRMKTRLAAFDAADQARRTREEDLNSLESFIYKARGILEESDFIEYSTESERSTLGKLLEDASEWIYEGGQTATSEVLKARLRELTDIVFPVQKRLKEADLRPEAIKVLEQSLEQTTTFVNMIKNSLDEAEKLKASAAAASEEVAKSSTTSSATVAEGSADPLAELEEDKESISSAEEPSATEIPSVENLFSQYTPEDLKDIEELYKEGRAYLDERLEKQKPLSITDDPAFESKDLENKAKKLNDDVMRIFERRMKWSGESSKPKKTKSKSEKSKTKKSKKTSSTSSTPAEETVTFEVPKESESAKPSEKDEL